MKEGAKTELNWAMFCHLGGLTTYIGIPLGNMLVPLAIWIWKRETVPAVVEHGREAVNFNISFTVYAVVAGILMHVLIGFILLPVVLLAHIGLILLATLKVNKGESVRYPLTLRFIK